MDILFFPLYDVMLWKDETCLQFKMEKHYIKTGKISQLYDV